MAEAAKMLGTLLVGTAAEAKGPLKEYADRLAVKFDPDKDDSSAVNGAPIVELAWSKNVMEVARRIKSKSPDTVVSVRLKLEEHATDRAEKLALEEAEIIHIEADYRGKGFGKRSGDFVIDLAREIHLKLVDNSIRDRVTLLVTGGIGMAEHLAKIIICGADGVGIDAPPLVAMECRLCAECDQMNECPVELDNAPVNWGAQRIVNLVGSWHSQLIEVLGAMGIREVRRLRGEVGRAMFFEDLERENFAPIFGERIIP
jgi:GNAT superfamily N-acetyltransferase